MKLGSPSLEIASRDSHIFSLATTSTFSAFLPGLLANRKMAQRSNRHSLNLIRQTALEAELFNRKRAQRIPSWPGVAHSNQGRIHWRRPFGHRHFLLEQGGGPYIGVNICKLFWSILSACKRWAAQYRRFGLVALARKIRRIECGVTDGLRTRPHVPQKV